MKSIKKVLALALALAMVVTAVPVTSAEAATTGVPKTKTYYAGKTYTLTLTTPKSWKSVKSTWSEKSSAVSLSSKKAKSVKVKAIKAGSATVKVKVTYKKSTKKNAKKYTKNYSCKVSVKEPSLALDKDAIEVAIGTTEAVKATVKPSTATVTFVSDNAEVATVDNQGTVTGVKAGEANITATATVGTKTLTATAKVTVKKIILDSVAQTKLKELTAVVKGDTKSLKATDFSVVNPTTKVVYPVYKVAVDAKDATKVTLTLLSDLNDGANYDVTLDGVTKSFKATDGTVASIAVDPVTIPYGTEKEIKLISKDANGVILKELTTVDAATDANYDFTITTNGNGYTNGSKLSLNKAGDTATAEITYKTGKYDKDGKPEGTIGPNKVTITAVEQSAVNTFAVRVDENGKKFDKAKETNKVALEDNTKYAYFKITDADGTEVSATEYNKYTIESTDNTVLMIGSNTVAKDTGVKLTPIKAGTAYIQFKTVDGKVVNAVAIDVVAKRAPAALTLDKTNVTVSNATDLADKANVEFDVKLKDQYGDDTALESNHHLVLKKDGKDASADSLVKLNETTKKVKVLSGISSVAKGVYKYTIEYVDASGKTLLAQPLTVTVLAPDSTIADDKDTFRLDIDKTEVDTTVKDLGADKGVNDYKKDITVKVVEQKAGVDYKVVTDAFTIKVLKADGSVKETVTNGKISSVSVTSDGAIKVTKNYDPGTYTIVATKGSGDNKKELKATFKITDAQTIAPEKVEKSVSGVTTLGEAVQKSVTVKYNDTTYNDTSLDIVSVEAIKNGNTTKLTNTTDSVATSTFVITKLTVLVNVGTDGNTVYAEVTVPVNGAITVQ